MFESYPKSKNNDEKEEKSIDEEKAVATLMELQAEFEEKRTEITKAINSRVADIKNPNNLIAEIEEKTKEKLRDEEKAVTASEEERAEIVKTISRVTDIEDLNNLVSEQKKLADEEKASKRETTALEEMQAAKEKIKKAVEEFSKALKEKLQKYDDKASKRESTPLEKKQAEVEKITKNDTALEEAIADMQKRNQDQEKASKKEMQAEIEKKNEELIY